MNLFSWKELWMLVGGFVLIVGYVLLIIHGMSAVVAATRYAEVIPEVNHPRAIPQYSTNSVAVVRATAFFALWFAPVAVFCGIVEFVERRLHKKYQKQERERFRL